MARLGFLMFKTLLIYMNLMNGCSNANTEVCKTSIGASSNGATTQDWIQWGDNYYKVIMEKMTWLEARDACTEKGATMVTPKSKNEGQFLAGITPLSDDFRHFWISCNDRLKEGIWECDGQTDISYQAWLRGEPNDYGEGEDCGVTYEGGYRWADSPCSLRLHAVCKKPAPMLHL